MANLRKIVFLAFCLIAPSVCCADQAGLEQAEKLYQSGEWAKALEAYKAELKNAGDPSQLPAAFFYNYGTAAAKAGAVGEAYVGLLRAAFFSPFDSDTKANLRQVEKQVPAAVLSIQPSLWFSWWPEGLRLIPWQIWMFFALLALALTFLFAPSADRSRWKGALTVALLLFAFSGIAWAQFRMPVFGVTQLAKVKSGPGPTFSDITSLEPGSLVNAETTRDGWVKVRFGKKDADLETVGWVELASVLEVR